MTETSTETATGSYRTGLTRAGLVSVTALNDAHLWVGLKSAQDQTAKLDLRVELLKNGTQVASGLRRCVGNLGAGSAAARDITVPWEGFTPPKLKPGDVLALRVSARMGTNSFDQSCGDSSAASGLRLFYDASERASRFGATITPDPMVDLYLHGDGNGCSATASALSLSEEVPTASAAKCQDSAALTYSSGNAWSKVGTWRLPEQCDCANEFIPAVRNAPPASAPEPIEVTELPLPPTAPSTSEGSCTRDVNPRGTGCIDPGRDSQAGGFVDDTTVSMLARYAGAPAAPDEGSRYSGGQIAIVKTDGSKFSNGDPWKCITCGVPDENKAGMNEALNYPQPFRDGKRILAGTNIIDCSPYLLVDDACTPEATHVYPIVWDGGSMRELRLNPDQVHLGWSHLILPTSPEVDPEHPSQLTALDQFAYFGRLVFNKAERRYGLVNIYGLYGQDPAFNSHFINVDPDDPTQLKYRQVGAIGEFRGFTGDGRAALGMGSAESSNVDIFATDLRTGKSERRTADPAYIDPVAVSPDNNWTVAMDVRYRDRFMFIAGMPGIPPVTDVLPTMGGVSAHYNNGQRRFFQPYLLDRYGDRGDYRGQRINACEPPETEETPGSICDPNWGGQADPRWSPDGTQVAYGQTFIQPPDCETGLVLDCPASTEDGGRRWRFMLARFTSREPLSLPPVEPLPDGVPWGTPWHPGDPTPIRKHIPAGTYTLEGRVFGSAEVEIVENADKTGLIQVSAAYDNYSDDGVNIINGTETVQALSGNAGMRTFHENLTLSGCRTGSKVTTPGGYSTTVLTAIVGGKYAYTGRMTTTIDGKTYEPPLPAH